MRGQALGGPLERATRREQASAVGGESFPALLADIAGASAVRLEVLELLLGGEVERWDALKRVLIERRGNRLAVDKVVVGED